MGQSSVQQLEAALSFSVSVLLNNKVKFESAKCLTWLIV